MGLAGLLIICCNVVTPSLVLVRPSRPPSYLPLGAAGLRCQALRQHDVHLSGPGRSPYRRDKFATHSAREIHVDAKGPSNPRTSAPRIRHISMVSKYQNSRPPVVSSPSGGAFCCVRIRRGRIAVRCMRNTPRAYSGPGISRGMISPSLGVLNGDGAARASGERTAIDAARTLKNCIAATAAPGVYHRRAFILDAGPSAVCLSSITVHILSREARIATQVWRATASECWSVSEISRSGPGE